LLTGSQFDNTTSGFTGTGQSYNGCFWSPENLDLDGCAANNPWGSYYDSGTGSVTWTATFVSGTEAIGIWAAQSDAYKPSGGGGSSAPPPTQMSMGVGD